MTVTESREPTLLAVLREPQPHIFVRSIASLILASVLAAGGLLCGWLAKRALFSGFFIHPHQAEEIALAAASVIWLLSLKLIWAPVRGRWQILRPIFSTIAIGVCALLLASQVRADALEFAIILLAIAATLRCWARAYIRWSRGRAVLGPDNVVHVRCPQCQYSLVGLTECRCPECGHSFTIDGLIAAQGYGGSAAREPTARRSPATPLQEPPIAGAIA